MNYSFSLIRKRRGTGSEKNAVVLVLTSRTRLYSNWTPDNR